MTDGPAASGPPALAVAPVAGRVVALSEVPDAVFAGQLVGAGVALEPDTAGGAVTVTAPVAGRLVKVHPHAFVVVGDDGRGLLVHVGIDTVRLGGRGFELLAAEGDAVEQGRPVVRVDPTVVAEAGLSAVCPVVLLDSAPDSVDQAAVGRVVSAGEALFAY